MKTLKVMLISMMGMALVVSLVASPATAQNDQQQGQQNQREARQMMTTQHMKDMNDMMARMNTVMNRMHMVANELSQVSSGQQMSEAQMTQMKDFYNAMSGASEKLRDTVDRYNTLRQDQALLKNSVATKDMDALQANIKTIIAQMNKAANTMEHLNKQLITSKPATNPSGTK